MEIETALFTAVLLLIMIGLSGLAWFFIAPIKSIGIYLFIISLAFIILLAYYIASRVFRIRSQI
ncbi:MAG TPA: hypothetical protein VED00_00320 [archaeon]|nr:hypothetical protein [archaeon]